VSGTFDGPRGEVMAGDRGLSHGRAGRPNQANLIKVNQFRCRVNLTH
jgi:hypothetical protein